MGIAAYIKEIGRGHEGARSLDTERAQELMAQVLDGKVTDLEIGAFALAMRIKGETPEELAGFMDAVVPCTLPLHSPTPAVVLPSYNGARKLPNFTPLLAMLLAREGVPTLVHGPLRDPARVTSAEVFSALGLPPVASADEAHARWAAGQPVFMAVDVLHPSLAALLALRSVLGVRNSGHTLAKLLPGVPGAVRVVNHTHPEYATSLADFLACTGATALLLRGTEGEPVADARRLPALKCFVAGQLSEALSVPAQGGTLVPMPALPGGIDAAGTARTIRAMLDGALPVPAPIARQVDCLLALRQTA